MNFGLETGAKSGPGADGAMGGMGCGGVEMWKLHQLSHVNRL